MSTSRRNLWTRKILGCPINKVVCAQTSAFRGHILGVDPSLRGSGFSVIEVIGNHSIKLHETLTLKLGPKYNSITCLGEIFKTTQRFLQSYPIKVVSIEQPIYVQNTRIAQILGSTRGACLAAVALAGIETKEYPPLRIKKSIVGIGRATKEQVSKMVSQLLHIDTLLPSDEADATAAALCHFFSLKSLLSP